VSATNVAVILAVCLGAVLAERCATVSACRERLRLEVFLSSTAASFVGLPSYEMDAVFVEWLGKLRESFALDEVSIEREMGGGEPAEATHRRGGRRKGKTGSALVLPLEVDGPYRLSLRCAGRWPDGKWPTSRVASLQRVAQIVASALRRKLTEDALRANETINGDILASLPGRVAVVDRDGWVFAMNDGAVPSSSANEQALHVGSNYLQLCRQAAGMPTPSLFEAADGIRQVLDESRGCFVHEYACGEHWVQLSAVPLRRAEGGAVISHTEVTERRRAKADAERSRAELAHCLRVSTMGELAASLAHELNQPLTAILANAEAARALLRASPLDVDEIDEMLSDIVSDDERTAGMIRRVRHVLSKGEASLEPLDLNGLVREVVRLLASDAMTRGVAIRLELDAGCPRIAGDRIQLQQVVLNLLINSMDAMMEVEHRAIQVRTERSIDGAVCLSVSDSGGGLRESAVAQAFEPFFTTKASGMGMGLTIARSIVEAHAGKIAAFNNPDVGATFTVSLPPCLPGLPGTTPRA
jgi:two-component system sensor kinase FixL